MKVPLLDLHASYPQYREELLAEITRIFDEQDFILGPRVRAAEEALAVYAGTEHAVGVASGTDALLLGLRALDVGRGDEVVTTPFTFFATAGAIANAGARPVFADIDPRTYNIDPDALEAAIGERTRAVIPVHLYGQCADMDRIVPFARSKALSVLEDAAQSLAAEWRGTRPGSLGHLAAVSFYPSKNLGGAGDGGVVLTSDEELAMRVRALRTHGGLARYRHEEVGTNSRLDVIQAAVVHVKLRYLDEWTAGRRRNAARYDAAFADLDEVVTPVVAEGAFHCYNQYVIRVPRRDELRAHLADRGIGSAIYYPIPLHRQPCFASLGYVEGDFPESERASRETLSIPVYGELPEAAFEHVVRSIREFFGAADA